MQDKNPQAMQRYRTGPLRWSQLPPHLEARARAIYYSCGLYVMPTFEQWEVGFCREEAPEQEIHIWESIDAAFRDYSGRRELNRDTAEDVVYALLCISLGLESDDPLQRELKGLYASA